ncbi:uncharacterized protein ACMZJ9_014147 [Mantella aurantiaca]
MANAGVTVLLLFLALVLGSNGSDLLCDIVNAGGNSSSAFHLTVSPETLSNNASYAVVLQGSGNCTVILEAFSTSGLVGDWSAGNISCNGSSLFLNPFENVNLLQAHWTSPQNVTSVNITAYIHNENGTFIASKSLSRAPVNPTANGTTIAPVTTANGTTIAPNTSNSTANSTTATTATTLVKTTSGASAVQTSLLAVIQILGLLTVTGNFLS